MLYLLLRTRKPSHEQLHDTRCALGGDGDIDCDFSSLRLDVVVGDASLTGVDSAQAMRVPDTT